MNIVFICFFLFSYTFVIFVKFLEKPNNDPEMSDYAKLKKLDEESLQKLKEGEGPVDQCICPFLSSSDDRKSFAASVKKVFKSIGKKTFGRKSPNFPVTIDKNVKGMYSSKEVIQRKSPCGKCGCDNEKIVLKHSYANIRITSPDVSSICPCDTNCLPDREKLQNNIKVIVENAQVTPFSNVLNPKSEHGIHEIEE